MKRNPLPPAPVYELASPELVRLQDVNADANPSGPDNTLREWDKQAGEDVAWYEKFLYYLRLGTDRSIQKACRRYLTERERLLPGEPIPAGQIYAWSRISVQWSWLLRARYWDRENIKELQIAIEHERQKRIQDMAEEHIAGWELFQKISIVSLVAKDDNGNPILDDNGNPKLKEIEDVGVAARVFKQATQGKRTEMGLPNDYLTMRGVELVRRYTELNAALQDAEDETIDGEVTELDEAAEAS